MKREKEKLNFSKLIKLKEKRKKKKQEIDFFFLPFFEEFFFNFLLKFRFFFFPGLRKEIKIRMKKKRRIK